MSYDLINTKICYYKIIIHSKNKIKCMKKEKNIINSHNINLILPQSFWMFVFILNQQLKIKIMFNY